MYLPTKVSRLHPSLILFLVLWILDYTGEGKRGKKERKRKKGLSERASKQAF